MTASAYCHGMPVSIHPHPRYVVFKDGIPLAQQAFIQRQSWLDLLQHPPCQETGFNLYSEGCTKLPACPNCYYPSLPRDSSRIDTASEAGHVTVNPVDMDEMANNRGTRRGFPRMTPYHCSAISPDGEISSELQLTRKLAFNKIWCALDNGRLEESISILPSNNIVESFCWRVVSMLMRTKAINRYIGESFREKRCYAMVNAQKGATPQNVIL